MTFVGKILVIVIMVFSLFFLAVSTVVFSTQKNWKDETAKLKTQITDLNKKKSDSDALAKKAETDLAAAKDEFDQQTKVLKAQVTDLTQQNAAQQQLLSEQNGALATAQQTLQAALREAEDRTGETKLLRDQLSAVQQQANQFKLTQTELNDQIRILERQLATATGNNKDLRERVALLSGALRRVGLSDDPAQLRGTSTSATPPDVEGYVKRVDARNQRVEISIGSDDGLVPGHELEMYRTNPIPEYLGRVRVESVDPDQAVAIVVGSTVQGKKITEGDVVSSKIRPRS